MKWMWGVFLIVFGSILFLIGAVNDGTQRFQFMNEKYADIVAWTGMTIFFAGAINFIKNQKTIAKEYKDIDPTTKIILKKINNKEKK